MPIELTARTEAGARFVAIAEELSEQLTSRAAEHDRDGTYPFEAIEALKAAGYFAAPIPIELGGLGVASAHDLVVASSRLARGDASVAIGVNMHLVAVLNMVRRHDVAAAAGAERRARAFAGSLEQIVHDGVVLAAAISERGQDLTGTVATRMESGWRIDGRKMFCTMSPAATDLYVAVTYVDRDGVERYAYAMVPTGSPGVIIHDDPGRNGDARLRQQLRVPGGRRAARVRRARGIRRRRAVAVMERNLHSGLFHAAASLGIAESGDALARRGIAGRINGDARPRMQIADNLSDNRDVDWWPSRMSGDHRDQVNSANRACRHAGVPVVEPDACTCGLRGHLVGARCQTPLPETRESGSQIRGPESRLRPSDGPPRLIWFPKTRTSGWPVGTPRKTPPSYVVLARRDGLRVVWPYSQRCPIHDPRRCAGHRPSKRNRPDRSRPQTAREASTPRNATAS